jgi:hypothetical protein
MNKGEGGPAREPWGVHDGCIERWTFAWGTQGTSTWYAIGYSETIAYRPRDPTSFRCFALEEVVMDADPGATAERLSSSQDQMWVNLGGQTTSYSSCGMWVGKTGGRW